LTADVESGCQKMTVVLPDSSEDSAARRVERELRKAIITLEIQPGASLSEKELADRYGVSRQPVREALINLGKAGLVGIQPRRGTFVVKISLDLMRQARFVRESLEVAVVRRACVSFDPAVRQRIDGILDRQAVLAAERLPAGRRSLPRSAFGGCRFPHRLGNPRDHQGAHGSSVPPDFALAGDLAETGRRAPADRRRHRLP